MVVLPGEGGRPPQAKEEDHSALRGDVIAIFRNVSERWEMFRKRGRGTSGEDSGFDGSPPPPPRKGTSGGSILFRVAYSWNETVRRDSWKLLSRLFSLVSLAQEEDQEPLESI